MKTYGIFFIVLTLIGGVGFVYQIYKMTVLDAESRGFKHPKFWGLVVSSGRNSSGLLTYMIGRRNYSSNMSTENIEIMEARKKIAAAGMLFQVIGFIGFLASIIL